MVRSSASHGLLLALALALAGCNPVKERAEAEACVARVFAARHSGTAEQALAAYADEAQQGMGRDEWSQMLVALDAKLGRPVSERLTAWNVTLATNSLGTGTFVSLQYDVTYERAEGTESIVAFKPSGASDFRIVGHHVNSPAFLLGPEGRPHDSGAPEAPARAL
jgi:hypothetical protein